MQEDIVEPVVQQSQLMWYYSALGLRYFLLLPLAGLFSFVATILLLARGRGAALSGGLIFVVAAPIFVGLIGTVEGATSAFQVIAFSQTAPKPSDVAEFTAMALVTLQVGLALAFPSFVVATIGLIVRSLSERDPAAIAGNPGKPFAPMPPSARVPS